MREAIGQANERGHLAIWLILFVVQRTAILWWGFDGVFFWEEAYRLLIAEALVAGWPLALVDLQADPYSGGSLVVSALAAPMVTSVGPGILGLKFVALAWSALGLLIWGRLIHRYFGTRVADLFALCYLCAPPLFATYNLIAMGSHAEVVTLAGVQFCLLLRYLTSERPPVRLALACGAIGGFAAWYSYTSLVPLSLGLLVIVLAGRIDIRGAIIMALGFAVGAVPWVVTNWQSGAAGIDVVVATFGHAETHPGTDSASLFHKLSRLARHAFPDALQFNDLRLSRDREIPGPYLGALYLTVFAAGWIATARLLVTSAESNESGLRGRIRELARRPETPLLMLFPAFVCAIAVSNQSFYPIAGPWIGAPFLAYRVLVPAFPGIFFAIARGFCEAPKALRIVAIAMIAVLGVVATGQMLAKGHRQRDEIRNEARVIGAEAMGHLLYFKFGAEIEVIRARLAGVPPEVRDPAWRGVGFSLAYHDRPAAKARLLEQELESLDSRDRANVRYGIRQGSESGTKWLQPRTAPTNGVQDR